ncbi:ribonucleoside-diphosphate reductase subunit alpha [Lentzea sp. NPDC042327]|uniref:ribonucleoside-diphosphate reductase subunit alpha n=1 Tax=Lentzea sp. NPDC042327 TaxID=3154801 RepID=UPI0033DE0A7E
MPDRLSVVIEEACADLPNASAEAVLTETKRNLYHGITDAELALAPIMAARAMVEQDPDYSCVSARLLLDRLRTEACGVPLSHAEMTERYPSYFASFVRHGVDCGQLDPRLTSFDLARLGSALDPSRDLRFQFLGLQTLYDRYFLHRDGRRYELPQAFFMRVAMGLALEEDDPDARAVEFYELLSSFDFMCSTPTLFNSGTTRPQLSSCFLTTVADDLGGIFHGISNNALLSKFAGGLGNDWTPVRGIGAHIRGTNGTSQGVVPFLKIANDTAVAVNQCFAPDTGVHTADGVKAIRDVVAGDLVLGVSGTYREVTDVMLYDQVDPMVEVEVEHSAAPLRVTAGHPLYAVRGVPLGQENARTLKQLAGDEVRPEWVDAGRLEKGDLVARVVPREVVPVAGFSEDDARLYGVLLGGGHLSEDGVRWGVSGKPGLDAHLDFVREHLSARGVPFRENGRDDTHVWIHWASEPEVGASAFPFTPEDLYDDDRRKRIARRFSHLPHAQTRKLLQGLLESSGGASRGVEVHFTTTSRSLAAGARYQLLRLGIPSAGEDLDVGVPAVEGIAELAGCRPTTEPDWVEHRGMVFSRVRDVRETEVVPEVFDLEVETDESYLTTAGLAHNGGKRKGAVCAYLETWHIDVEEFLDLRKNTGDERRRTHDMNTANWVPDEFLRRVRAGGTWTLFSPDEVPDLHDAFGAEFAEKYRAYEAKADGGGIKVFRRVQAVDLWRRMLTMLFETGHPWITFKDPCNLRSPQQHSGVVHSSNLCTEITLNTAVDEVAVCNLGSVNLARHVTEDGIDHARLRKTVRTAVRMLDNVIDVNYYTIPEARNSNLRHRPVGLGLMGFQDALFTLGTPMASQEAVEFADRSMEEISYYAIEASADLARERGAYRSFDGSLWSRGVLPIDSVEILARHRAADELEQDRGSTMDWAALRAKVRQGMRNSNVMAIAPTATIANIAGVNQSIEPLYRNLYVKSNMSGDFTVVNPHLVRALKQRGLWDEQMVSDLKLHDGSLGAIDRVPPYLKALYATAFEVDSAWLVEAGSRRQKWIDQAQSLNLYLAAPSGRKLDELYRLAWLRGLKTTYYLRTQSATHVEKSTLQGTDGKLNAVSPVACSTTDTDCEACQ